MRRFSFLLVVICLNLSAQKLKTYSGEYCYALSECGSATYTYTEGENKRIFHGKFSYSDKKRSLKGNFLNDKQDGEWVCSEKTNFYVKKKFYSGRRIISLTYKNGIPAGPFSITLVDSNTNETKAYISAHFVNGKLAGIVKADMNTSLFDLSGNNFSSSFDVPYHNIMNGLFDENGLPSGNWKVYCSTCEIIEQYSPDGSYNIITTNPSNGDIIKNDRKAYMPNMIVEAANIALRKTRMRSSDTIEIPYFEFGYPVSSEYKEEIQRRMKNKFSPDIPYRN